MKEGGRNNQAQARAGIFASRILAKLATVDPPFLVFSRLLRLPLCPLLRPEKVKQICRVRRLWNTGRLRLKLPFLF